MRMQGLNYINSLKGLAMCMIVARHCGMGMLPSYLGQIGKSGKYGVELFMVISAMLSFVSYNSNVLENKKELYWLGRKIIKFVPLYYLAIILNGCFLLWVEKKSVSIFDFLTHFLFINGLFPQYANSIVGGGWYLATLVLFYVLTPLFYKYVDTLEKALIFFSSSLVISYGICNISDVFILPIYSDYNWYFSIWAQLPIWALGIILYYLWFQCEWQFLKTRKLVSSCLLFLSLIIVLGEILEKNNILFFSIYLRYAIGFAVLVVSQWIYINRIACNKLLEIIGKKSFAIYLYHMLVIKIYDKINLIDVENEILNWGIKYIFVMLFTFVAAMLLTKYYDKSVYGRLNSLYNKLVTKLESC